MLTNKLGLPQPFVDAATDNHKRTAGRYSVTETLGGTCEAVLKRRHLDEVEEDVADRVWAIFGTAIHKVLQEAKAEPWQEREKWVCVPVGDFEMSGVFDLYDSHEHKVTDWKTCSVWKTQVGDFKDWQTQVLTYCWMLERLGRKARHGEVVAIMRDHSMRDAKTKPEYPTHPVLKVSWDFSEADIEAAGERVGEWFADLAEQLSRPDSDLVPCSPEDRWSKPTRWAVMKDGRKKAVRVFDDEGTAEAYLETVGDGHHIERREGEDTKCMSYCPVAKFCPHGREFL